MMNKKWLSINSDDFGLSSSINEGIKDAFQKGILTDASLMANGPAFGQAIKMASEYKIPISAHINLIRGKMLTDFAAAESVINLWKQAFNKSYMQAVETEVRSQIEKILKEGIKIYQLNSEKHSHFFPPLFRLWLKLAPEYGIPYVRFIREFNLSPSSQGLKANLLSALAIKNRQNLKKSGTRSCRYFCGILATGKLTEQRLAKILQHIKPGWTELMVHVGYCGDIDPIMGHYFLNTSREKELKALLNPRIKGIIKDLNINLRGFGGNNG